MKVLILGGGGREHALAWKLASSSRVDEVVVAPGNAGMGDVARVVPSSLEPQAVLALARRERPDLTVVGPEAPLAAGVVDLFTGAGFAIFGPNLEAARLEASKRHAKDFMRRYGIPTADYTCCSDLGRALAYLHDVGAPIVVKDSHLAAGKGVVVADSVAEAEGALRSLFSGGAGEVVLEKRLQGQEVSVLLFTDGRSYRTMPLAQDYKQALDGDLGPMTGGMGAVAPAGLLDAAAMAEVERRVIEPTLRGLRHDGVDYRGVLFIGLMLTADGPQVLEYNVRFGDPETQVVLPLLESDLLELLEAVVAGRLGEVEPRWSERAAACVVLAAPGYPGSYRKGVPLAIGDLGDEAVLFHAGTARHGGALVSSGGRVLDVVATGDDVGSAVARAYRAVEAVDFPGGHWRRDIGARLERD